MRASGDQEMAAEMIDIYRTLNRITADQLHEALTEAGFEVVKLALDAEAVHLPAEVRRLPLSTVGISGIKLLAIPGAEPAPASEPDAAAEPGAIASHQQDAIPPEPAPEPSAADHAAARGGRDPARSRAPRRQAEPVRRTGRWRRGRRLTPGPDAGRRTPQSRRRTTSIARRT